MTALVLAPTLAVAITFAIRRWRQRRAFRVVVSAASGAAELLTERAAPPAPPVQDEAAATQCAPLPLLATPAPRRS